MTDSNQPGAKDPARARFFALVLIRWIGVGLVLLGLLVTSGRVALPWIAGPIFVVFGLFDAFVMPVILARKWKSQDQ